MIARAALLIAAAMALSQARSHVVVGSAGEHIVLPGESWVSISARLGIPVSTLLRQNSRAANGVLVAGESIAVDARHLAPGASDRTIVINVPQRLLFLYRDGALAAHFPIAVGLPDWRTPLGEFTVRELEENPTWDVPVSIREEMRREGHPVLTKVAPGPKNPLGKHWIGLTLPGVGIHGTNVPTSIYRSTTHGCIRMHPDDVAVLFASLREGDTGRIVYEPVMAAVDDAGAPWLEVHPDFYRRVPRMLDHALEAIRAAGGGVTVSDVEKVVREKRGIAVRLAGAGR